MDHAKRMKMALDAAGYSQSEIARELGVGQSTVSQWLKGSRRPERGMLERFASLTGTTAMWLDYGEGEGPRSSLEPTRAAYRSDVHWMFTSERPDGSRDFGNANIFSFKPTVSAFVREVLQNIGDAAPSGPAQARILLRRLRGADVTDFLSAMKWQEFEPHLEASVRSGQQVGSALEEGLRAVEARQLLLLEVSDFGTTGLLGPDVGRGNFAALCRNNLDSNKSNVRAGGSYGLGKAVLWRMSSLSTVLFLSNLAEPAPDSGRQHGRFIARSELVWHKLKDGTAFAGPGWLAARESTMPERPISYWENSALARDLLFTRNLVETGTSIIVVGFRDPSSDADPAPATLAGHIEDAIAENFWPALTLGGLSVSVQVAEGSDIHRTVDVDVNSVRAEFADLLQRHRRNEVVDVMMEPGDVVRVPVDLEVPACTTPGQEHPAFVHRVFVLVRRADASGASSVFGQAQYFRGTGMVIDRKDMSRILVGVHPFHVSVLCGTAAGDSAEDELAERFLRAAEPPAHNTWEITEKVQREYARGSGAAINRLHSAVRSAVRSVLTPLVDNAPDGPRDLAAMFKLGQPSRSERSPRLIVDSASVKDDGAWHVEATIRVPNPEPRIVGRPFVRFQGETGSGAKVRWRSLEAVKDCSVESGTIVVAEGKRTARFRGVTDPSSHPVPSRSAAVSVEFSAVREELKR